MRTVATSKNSLTKEQERCQAVKDMIESCESEVSFIKERWRENYDMFAYGSQNKDKKDWQTNFSINKLENSIRASAGSLVDIILNNPDWYSIEPRAERNAEAAYLAGAFKKVMDYYLDAAKFKRSAANFFLCALISSGNMFIGWKKRLVPNPEYIVQQTEELREREARRLAKSVANPDVTTALGLSGEEMEEKINAAIDGFMAEAQGEPAPKPPKAKPYIELGCLDIRDLNHERVYWDPNVQYMEDSVWRAFDFDVNRFELEQQAELGFFPKSALARIGTHTDPTPKNSIARTRYKNLTTKAPKRSNLVKITVYCGPLVVNNKIKKQNYYAVIANDTVILKESDYPFWEPPGHHTAVLTAAVRNVPYRATGAGVGDNAVQLQRVYDSNWQLVCDTYRYGIGGINIVNWSALVDRSQLDEGLYPGITLEARTEPDKVFKHVNLTNNIENQAAPVQSVLEAAIDNATGVNQLQIGGGNKFSRTSASETNARLEAGRSNTNTIASDLEDNFLIPALEKIFARILQFGIPDISRNPELQALLSEEELRAITQFTAGDRMGILNQWYKLKVNGFSAAVDRDAEAQRDNELLSIWNSGGPLQSILDPIELMRRVLKNRGVKDTDKLLVVSNSPLEVVTSENKVLMAGNYIAPNPAEDLEFHLQQHASLAQSPSATPAMIQHYQETQMLYQQAQQMQAQSQQVQGQGPMQ